MKYNNLDIYKLKVIFEYANMVLLLVLYRRVIRELHVYTLQPCLNMFQYVWTYAHTNRCLAYPTVHLIFPSRYHALHCLQDRWMARPGGGNSDGDRTH